jgi:hypothetical protein
VDRLDTDRAVLVHDDSGAKIELSRRSLPRAIREGDVLRVLMTERGEPDWPKAVIDPELRRERLRNAQDGIERLKRRDPGGNVQL